MRKSSPAWSFVGKASEKLTKIQILPGPGAYQPNDPSLDASPRWGTSKSPKIPDYSSLSPGPGSYLVDDSKQSKSFCFGKAKRLEGKNQEETPGPGAYSQETRRASPSISIKNTRYEGKANGFPGPGSYLQGDEGKNQSPKYSVGKAVKLKFVTNDLPGPGNYNFIPPKSGPAWKLGSEGKDHLNYSKTPGPGNYFHDSKDNSPSFTMKSRYESKKRENSPGPGAYSPSQTEKRLKISVGISEKMPFRPSIFPGPGSYTPSIKSLRKLGSFSKTERKLMETLNTSPGVGSYETKSTLEGPKFSLGSKPTIKNPLIPGPGTYTPKYFFKELPNIKIGKESRLRNLISSIPGPGSYKTEGKLEGPKWKFSSSPKHETLKKLTPGPGDYEIKPTIPNIAEYYNIN